MAGRDIPVTEDELHAFVDGELPPDRKSAVEAWLATHPDDAARVAAWQAQAEQIRARFAGIGLDRVPPHLDVDRLGRFGWRWKVAAVAAVLLAFLAGGASGWLGRGAFEGSPLIKTVTADAIDAHKLYVVEVRHPVEVTGAEHAHLVAWLSKRIGYELKAPNLDPLGLKLVGGRLLPGASAAAAFLMYEGNSGERFTFYCVRSPSPETALRYRAAGPVGAFYWVDHDVAYVVSGPADRDRLHKVAEAIYGQLEARPVKERNL